MYICHVKVQLLLGRSQKSSFPHPTPRSAQALTRVSRPPALRASQTTSKAKLNHSQGSKTKPSRQGKDAAICFLRDKLLPSLTLQDLGCAPAHAHTPGFKRGAEAAASHPRREKARRAPDRGASHPRAFCPILIVG